MQKIPRRATAAADEKQETFSYTDDSAWLNVICLFGGCIINSSTFTHHCYNKPAVIGVYSTCIKRCKGYDLRPRGMIFSHRIQSISIYS
jgi:hypothetical protein